MQYLFAYTRLSKKPKFCTALSNQDVCTPLSRSFLQRIITISFDQSMTNLCACKWDSPHNVHNVVKLTFFETITGIILLREETIKKGQSVKPISYNRWDEL